MDSVADSSFRLPTRQGSPHCSKNATICGAQDAILGSLYMITAFAMLAVLGDADCAQ